jgi:predicted GNAT family acetyltransferase
MIPVLDNPVWEALSSHQSHLNAGSGVLKYFPAAVAPFIALNKWNERDIHALKQEIPAGRTFSVLIAKKIELPGEVEIVFSTPLYQMYCPVVKPAINTGITAQTLTAAHVPQMLELTNLTKPGPFYERTIEFGNYLGVFDAGKLVAMAGERLKVNGYTELSAVCTHPAHLGKGYASYLSSLVAERITRNGDCPFLHVRADNLPAIELYKKLGVQIRADIYFAAFKKQ